MPRDDLVLVKTMNDIKTSRNIWPRPIRTSQQAFRTRELVYPVDERAIAIALQQERLRWQRRYPALERQRKGIERSRAKFYQVREKNLRLRQLRYQLQSEFREKYFGPEAGTSALQQQPRKALKPRVKEVRIRRG